MRRLFVFTCVISLSLSLSLGQGAFALDEDPISGLDPATASNVDIKELKKVNDI